MLDMRPSGKNERMFLSSCTLPHVFSTFFYEHSCLLCDRLDISYPRCRIQSVRGRDEIRSRRFPGSPADEMGRRLGVTGMEYTLGVLEFIIIALFLIPRTSTVGFVLMIGYLGARSQRILTHGFTNMEALPIYILFLLLMISAWFRNPELTARLPEETSFVLMAHLPDRACK